MATNDLVAVEIVKKIKWDFTNRRGLRQEWENIDDEMQAEIQTDWIQIVKEILHRQYPEHW